MICSYISSQVCHNVKSTADFSPVGVKVPLVDAMTTLACATDEILQLRKCHTSIGVIIRTLLELQVPVSVETLRLWYRHSFIKSVSNSVLVAAKVRLCFPRMSCCHATPHAFSDLPI
jgi:hypothetical protein